MQTDVLIIGGGLSGLSLARTLSAAGIDFLLAEARDRFGGRIQSVATDTSPPDARYDLGPSWFWPEQPHMERLLGELHLDWFEQADQGTLVLQESDGSIRRDLDLATMSGSRRIIGGLQTLVERLADGLPSERLLLNQAVTTLNAAGDILTAETNTSTIRAKTVAVCLPPRLIADTITFTPTLGDDHLRALSAVPTWMAGHAKFTAIYDRPFWREQNLSGDAISRIGPLVEVHDASANSGDEGALFGFVGVPAQQRQGAQDAVIQACVSQLATLFGAQASTPKSVMYTDWSEERFTATPQDALGAHAHPTYLPPAPLPAPWAERLLFSSTETAIESAGLLEGALDASSDAATQILKHLNIR